MVEQLGRFIIEETLGAGAMGTVYRAQDTTRGSTVALKVLHWADATALWRFKTEFRSLANLAHPNLLQLYELITANDQYQLSMELVDGKDFLAHVRSGGQATQEVAEDPSTESIPPVDGSAEVRAAWKPRASRLLGALDEPKLRAALRQLAEGLQALHRSGRIHRDLKPANVLVFRADARLVICDFGLVVDSTIREREANRLPPRGGPNQTSSAHKEIAGTLAYMAPEQAAGAEVTEASDWYSVGVMLYQALTLQLPFDPSLRWEEALRAKREQTPAHPLTIAPQISSDLAELAMSLLAAKPEERAGYRDVVAVLSGRAEQARARSDPPELMIGREAELVQLNAAYARAKSGAATLALISGNSGMGKSSLVRQLLQRALGEGTLVLQGRCYECEDLPYKAVDPLIDALTSFLLDCDDPKLMDRLLPRDIGLLRAIFPVLARVPAIAALPQPEEIADPVSRKRRAAVAFGQLSRRLAEERTLIFYVDDLQWGDLDSAEFFTELLRGGGKPRLLLLFAYRAENEENSALVTALRKRQAKEGEQLAVRVDALPPSDAFRLAEALLSGVRLKQGTLEAIAEEAQGSPFFVRELCASVRAARGTHVGGKQLATVIQERVASLPPACRTLLECVATAGRRELMSVIETASCLGSETFAAAQVLKAHNMVQSEGTGPGARIEASHDRIRETVYRGLSESRRREVHRMLATALEQNAERHGTARDMEALLAQWRGAGELRRAAECALGAAEKAERALAFGHAAKLYKQALELSPEGSAQSRSALEERLGNALMYAGHGTEAADAFLRAMHAADPERSQQLRREALTQLLRAGQFERAFKGLEEAEDVLGIRFPSSNLKAILMLLWRKARTKLDDRHLPSETSHVSSEVTRQLDNLQRISVALSSVDFLRGGVYTAELTLRALKAKDPRTVSLALSIEALRSASANTKPSQTEWITRHSEELARRSGDAYVLAVSKGTTGVSRYLEGRFAEALDFSRESAEIHQRDLHSKFAWDIMIDLVFELRAHAQVGRVHEIVTRVPEALRDAERRGDIYAMSALRLGRLCWAWLGPDQPAAAREQIRIAEQLWVQKPYQLFHYYVLQSTVETALYEGQSEEAFQRLAREWKAMNLVRNIQFCRVEAHFMRGRLALQLAEQRGDAALLDSARKDADALAKMKNAPWAAALSGLLRAGITSHTSRDSARDQLVGIAADLSALGMLLPSACARYRAAQLTRGAEGVEAREQSARDIAAFGISRPERFVAMLAPGFTERD